MDIKYEVILTTQAKMELNNIYKYISNFFCLLRKQLKKFIDKFKTSILRLEHLPKSCSIISEDINSKYEYRKLIINNYIVIYSIDEENRKVYIHRIIYQKKVNYLKFN